VVARIFRRQAGRLTCDGLTKRSTRQIVIVGLIEEAVEVVLLSIAAGVELGSVEVVEADQEDVLLATRGIRSRAAVGEEVSIFCRVRAVHKGPSNRSRPDGMAAPRPGFRTPAYGRRRFPPVWEYAW